jgi:GT2 family glycosyltransferase
MTTISAVLLAFHRPDAVRGVLERLRELPVDEVIVVDNSLDNETADVVRADGSARLVKPAGNVGIAGRNLGAREATGEYLLFLDDDSYPLPGAIEELLAVFAALPRAAVVGGLVRDVDGRGRVLQEIDLGTFDWWLRAGAKGPAPAEGFPAFFFPEGACLVRRSAFLEVGGFYEPFFFGSTEVELSSRFLAAGWDVRYQPRAGFDHLKAPTGRATGGDVLKMRVRNHLWFLWLRYPPRTAVARMIGYGLFDLINGVFRGAPGAVVAGAVEAWRGRDTVRADRHPVDRALLARMELRRGRMHASLLARRVVQRIGGRRAGELPQGIPMPAPHAARAARDASAPATRERGAPKIGFIIRAHDAPGQLVRLVDRLDGPNNVFYIHVNERTDDDTWRQMRAALADRPNVVWLDRRRAYWGGYSLLLATLDGIVQDDNLGHRCDALFLPLSGQDYPLVTADELAQIVAARPGVTMMDHSAIPSPRWAHEEGGRRRFRYYWLEQLRIRSYVIALPIRRRLPDLPLYAGSAFICLGRPAADYILTLLRDDVDFVRWFQWTKFPDESFFQTALMNSPVAHTIANEDLWFVDWSEHRANPKLLGRFELRAAMASRRPFARKFDFDRDPELLTELHRLVADHSLSGPR